MPDDVRIYASVNHARFVRELAEFIRFPSVSAQPGHAMDVRRCAEWLAEHLQLIDLKRVRVIPTSRHPLVYAEWLNSPQHPTVLIYGHYDVQPADPLAEWRSPPFQPVVRGAKLYGRGASDDKGQLFTHVKALEAYLKTERTLPVNVKCIFEGEEEIGSPNLPVFLARNRRALKADVAVVSDMPILAPNRPAITYAMRGALSFELEVTGPRQDLHSGIYGGVVHNPLQALCEIIAHLHDASGRVAIPGFYKRVRVWDEDERDYMAQTGPTNGRILRDGRIQEAWGEPGYSLYERTTIRPALSVNGIVGGYQGAGTKAVIPARVVAKLNFRLVPDQDPDEIERLCRQYVAHITPPTVRTTVRRQIAAQPALVNRRHPAMQAASIAYRQGFGAAPVFLRSGGTIPVVNTLQKGLGIPTVLMGFALPDDQVHGPNEKFHLPNFFNGITTSIWFLSEVAFRLGRKHDLTQTQPGLGFSRG